MQYKTLRDALVDNSLIGKIKSLNPAVVFIHLGQSDLLRKSPGNEVVLNMKKLLEKLNRVENTKICVSLLIPLIGLPSTNSIIKQVNREISRHISELRRKTEYEPRYYTQNNDRLSGFIQQSSGKHGVTYSLNGHGQRKLWLQLKDGLNRSVSGEVPVGNEHQSSASATDQAPRQNLDSQRNTSHHE